MTNEEKNKILHEMHLCILNEKPWKGLKRTKRKWKKALTATANGLKRR